MKQMKESLGIEEDDEKVSDLRSLTVVPWSTTQLFGDNPCLL